MEVRIQEPDSKQSAAGLRWIKLPGPAACPGDPATNKMMDWCKLPKTGMIWINTLSNPSSSALGKIPGRIRLKSALMRPCNLQHRCRGRHFSFFQTGLWFEGLSDYHIYYAGPPSIFPNKLRLDSRKVIFSLTTKVCELNCDVFSAL